jgi:UDP-N-acetyl-D-glucosamine dehydrogenase
LFRKLRGKIMSLEDKIKNKTAKVALIGLGYVGLPLALEFAKNGFKVFGIDIDKKRVASLKKGKSYILDIKDNELKQILKSNKFEVTTDYNVIKKTDIAIITVPTPLRKTGEPDISFIINAINGIFKYLHREMLIILESTTYPGTTEELILPILSKKGLKVGKDFYLAFSPERIDPANKKYRVTDIPKVVGGITKKCNKLSKFLYRQIIPQVIEVSSPKVAEMVKLLENSFRSVNIALANETALICNRLGIDVWEVISAAKTKPFGFIPFYPGPGIGGHCIPLDPMFLAWKSRLSGYVPRFIELAQQINSYMSQFVVEKIINALNEKNKAVKNSKILIIGIAYKPEVNDTRESPALEIIKKLIQKKAKIFYHDPYVAKLKLNGKIYTSLNLRKEIFKKMDCIVIVTNHEKINYKLIVDYSKLIIDTRNALANFKKKNIIKI